METSWKNLWVVRVKPIGIQASLASLFKEELSDSNTGNKDAVLILPVQAHLTAGMPCLTWHPPGPFSAAFPASPAFTSAWGCSSPVQDFALLLVEFQEVPGP